jgi:hypothetical protein
MAAATAATRILANGKVLSVRDGIVIFAPTGTNYEMHLASPAFAGPLDTPVKGIIRVVPKKIWTVPSGGLFISPIFGPPKTIQGRIRTLDETSMIVHAGGPVTVALPTDETIFELPDGPLMVGAMVNVTALPGATFELAG